MTVLEVTDIAKAFGGVHAVDSVGFSLAAGERLAIIGPNGAGKSTCFNLIHGQIRPDRGRVRFQGLDVTGKSPTRLARLGMARTFQIPQVFASMTVREATQLMLAARERAHRRLLPRLAGRFGAEADDLLARTQLSDKAEQPCSVLAYGDVKRVELALALAARPALLLMDEPTAGMAPAERGALMELVDDMVTTEGLAVLFTEHDVEVVFTHADRILVLDRGRVLAEGLPEEIRANPAVQRAYLGSSASPDAGGAA